jgi:hypothetical protein
VIKIKEYVVCCKVDGRGRRKTTNGGRESREGGCSPGDKLNIIDRFTNEFH